MSEKTQPGSSSSSGQDGRSPRFFCLTCRKGALAVLLIIFALGAAAILVLPRLLDVEQYKRFIEQTAGDELGVTVSIGDARFSLLAGPGLVLQNIIITDKGHTLLTVKQAVINVNLIKTVLESPELDAVKIYSPSAILVRDRNGKLNIGRSEKSEAVNLPLVTAGGVAFCRNIVVKNGNVAWTDWGAGPEPVKARLSAFEFTSRRSGKRATLFASGLIDGKGRPITFEIKGNLSPPVDDKNKLPVFAGRMELEGLDVERFWPYIGPYVPFQKIKATASLRAKFGSEPDGRISSKGDLKLTNVNIRYIQAFKNALKPGDITVHHDLSFDGDTLFINEAGLKTGDLDVKLGGSIAGVTGPNPVFALEVNTNQVRFRELRKYIPDNVLSPQQTAFLNQNVMSGRISLKNIRFGADLKSLTSGDKSEAYKSVSGALGLADFNFTFGGLLRRFNDVNGVVTLKENGLFFDNVRGRYGSSELKEISGKLENVHGWPRFRLVVKADLDLEETRHGLGTIIISPAIRKQFEKVDSMSGSVTFDVSVQGDTKNLAESLDLNGKMSFYGVGVRGVALGLPLSGLSGEVKVDRNRFVIPSLSWKAGSSSFLISGMINDYMKPVPLMDLNFESDLWFADVNRIPYLDFGNLHDLSGRVFMKADVTGPLSDFKVKSRLDMTHAGFRFINLVDKKTGVPNSYTFEGALMGQDRLTINRLLMEIGDSKIEVTGRIGRFLRGTDMDLTVSSGGARFNDLDSILKFFEDIESEGTLSGKFSMRKKASDEAVALSGGVSLNKATFKLPVFHEPFRECDARFELLNNQIFLRDGVGLFGEGRLRASGTVNVEEKNRFTLRATTTALDLKDLFGAEDKEEEEETEEEPGEKPPNFFDGVWDILISSDSGKIGPITYSDLDTSIGYEDKVFRLSPFTFEAHGGKWRWDADLRKLPGEIAFDSEIDIQDLDMGRYLAESANKEKIITGALNLRGKLSGHGKGWDNIKTTLGGQLEARSGKGVIHRFQLLSKIFSLLNVSQYFKLKVPDLAAEGMPFESVEAGFKVASGVAHTENLLIESESMRISAIGDYDIGANGVDMQVGVMPFITIDRVLSSIPIVGHVLTNENRSFITSYYQVKGPLDSPEIKAVPFESLASNVVGIFKRFFMLPVKAIDLIKKSPAKPGDQSQEERDKKDGN